MSSSASLRARGQAAPLMGLMLVVLFGFAGLALDAGHLYLVQRNARNAADSAALAAGKRLTGALQKQQPASQSNTAIKAAHDYAYNNGFITTYPGTCDRTITGSPQAGLNQFTTSWFDTAVTCTATSGFNTRVTVTSPPPILSRNCQAAPYNCLQVVITQRVQNYLMGVLGQPVAVISAAATVLADPASNALSIPPPVALYLYEPGPATCAPASQQCFDQTKAPQRAGMNCSGTGNCPTFWVLPGSSPLIAGINGSLLGPATDTVALQSNGYIVLQDNTVAGIPPTPRATTICDPFGGAVCSAGAATGVKGFAINASGPPATQPKLYCSGFAGTPPGSGGPPNLPCTTPGPGTPPAPLGPVIANETGFAAMSWPASLDLANLPPCAGLVLNGGTVNNSFVGGPDSRCLAPAFAPYTVQPGQYDFVVINHGKYDFDSGFYLITKTAPQNTSPVGSLANGIDHSQENLVPGADWDLCTGPLCSLTAGMWVGHGSSVPGSFVPGAQGSSENCLGGGAAPGQVGGGDVTQVTGNGVSFVFSGPLSGGFVSTHEVDFIGLVAPSLGQQPRTSGAPLLFVLDNSSFLHLDASGSNTLSRFKGILYQTQASATAGGVEVNPGLGGSGGAIVGQVWAYSLTTFGSPGFAVDFKGGLGAATAPVLTTTGEDEPEILGPVNLVDAGGGKQTLVVQYNDEWKLDAYDVWVKVNNAAPRYFSEGVWVTNPPPVGLPLPPNPNLPGAGPSDLNPVSPDPLQDPANHYSPRGLDSQGKPDWTMNYADGATFRIDGDWVWGHEQAIPGATSTENFATLYYTWTIPPGPVSTVTLFMSDGDSCGDFVTATWTLTNVVPPTPGVQIFGTVHLEQ